MGNFVKILDKAQGILKDDSQNKYIIRLRIS